MAEGMPVIACMYRGAVVSDSSDDRINTMKLLSKWTEIINTDMDPQQYDNYIHACRDHENNIDPLKVQSVRKRRQHPSGKKLKKHRDAVEIINLRPNHNVRNRS